MLSRRGGAEKGEEEEEEEEEERFTWLENTSFFSIVCDSFGGDMTCARSVKQRLIKCGRCRMPGSPHLVAEGDIRS